MENDRAKNILEAAVSSQNEAKGKAEAITSDSRLRLKEIIDMVEALKSSGAVKMELKTELFMGVTYIIKIWFMRGGSEPLYFEVINGMAMGGNKVVTTIKGLDREGEEDVIRASEGQSEADRRMMYRDVYGSSGTGDVVFERADLVPVVADHMQRIITNYLT